MLVLQPVVTKVLDPVAWVVLNPAVPVVFGALNPTGLALQLLDPAWSHPADPAPLDPADPVPAATSPASAPVAVLAPSGSLSSLDSSPEGKGRGSLKTRVCIALV